MTTSTSSSARRRGASLLTILLVAGCGPSDGASGGAPDRPVAARPAKADVVSSPPTTSRADPAALYTADMAKAVAGARKAPFEAKVAFGGMACTPETIGGTSAASRALTLTLPADRTARSHVLAVVTPERGVLELYSPYADAAEAEDIVVPSQTISWSKARTQNSFATSTDELDGLRPGRDTPEALFIEPGRYRFALVNGIDAALLKANGDTVKVLAACSFDWTP